MTESVNFSNLTARPIIDLLIEGEYLPRLTGNEIVSLGTIFNINVEDEWKSRWIMMEQVLSGCHSLNKSGALLAYMTNIDHLKTQIELLRRGNKSIENIEVLDENGDYLSGRDIQRQIIAEWKKAVNRQLEYSDLKLVYINGDFDIIPLNVTPEIMASKQRIDNELLKGIIFQAENDLKDGDYDSVVTKSRTILEGTFMQILDDNGIVYKENGNLGEYRGLVVGTLGMKIESSWNPRVKKLVSGINKVVDAINEMRNDDSDAHVSNDRVAIGFAEAQLLINSSVAIATYYLMIFDRQI